MKKITILSAMILSIAIFSGYKLSGKNEISEKTTKSSSAKNSQTITKQVTGAVKNAKESFQSEKASAAKPQIMLLLINDTGQWSWSPSLWWKYKHQSVVTPGC